MCNKENLKSKFLEIIKTESKEEIKARLVIVGRSEFFDVEGVTVGCPKEMNLDAQLDNYGNCAYCSQCWKNTIKHYQKIDSVSVDGIDNIIEDYTKELTKINRDCSNSIISVIVSRFGYSIDVASYLVSRLKPIIFSVHEDISQCVEFENIDPQVIEVLESLGYCVEFSGEQNNRSRKYKVSKSRNPSSSTV